MKNQVKVSAHPVTGQVWTKFAKPGKDGKIRGKIRVDQSLISLEGGIGNKKNRSAFITLDEELYKEMSLSAGSMLDGKIVRKESRTPFYEGQQPKINPTEKKIHLVDGAPVYFKDEYTADLSANDELITGTISLGAAVAERVAESAGLNG